MSCSESKLPDPASISEPLELFNRWFAEAVDAGIELPEAMTLATASVDGRPSARVVLLKRFDARGFVFFTNYGSRKAAELDANPYAALALHWKELDRQIRVEGRVRRLDRQASEEYFRTRPRISQIGAWASRQSSPLARRQDLRKRFDTYSEQFGDRQIPLPEHWGGYCLSPTRIEFWLGRKGRLHERLEFSLSQDNRWERLLLFP